MKLQDWLLASAALLMAGEAAATIKNVRVAWDANPSTEAVIGFSRSGSSSSGQYVTYGTSTTESSWTTNSTVASRTFKTSLVNYFVRLNSLSPDTEYFFKACDSSGCSAAHMFRTAPAGQKNMTFITGGDSRTNQSQRQQGNRLVAKTRPAFVMFSGDLTDNHSYSEVDTWLTDWLLSYTDTVVNGTTFKQVYPIVPTVGNHEASDMAFVCSVFGVDADKNGSCSLRDTYNAFNIGTMLRVYTLNTEFDSSSYTNERAAQLAWLQSDLPANYTATTWRVAQYHKPMFPRSSSKNAINQIAFDWASTFYNYKLNLGVESDTHLAKYTYPVMPGSSDYTQSTTGTVYIGEGAWGAPTRTADRSSSWIAAQDSFAHINIVQATPTAMDVRTVYLSGEGSTATLAKATRDADPLALPTGLSLWSPSTTGAVYQLKLASDNRTELASGGGGGGGGGSGSTATLSAVADVTVGSGGYYGNGTTVKPDGDNSGQVQRGLVAWNVSGIPSTSTVSAASLQIQVTNSSTGAYNVYAVTSAWTEAGATYANAQATGSLIGSITPSSTGSKTITLNADGIAMVQGWINGTVANNGIVFASGSTTDGLEFTSREGGSNVAKLVVTYQ